MELTDADEDDVEDLSSEVVHKLEYIPANEKYQPKDEEDQAEELNKEYVSGMRIRRRPESYVPSMEGK